MSTITVTIIRTLDNERFNVEVHEEADVLGLKLCIYQETDVALERQRLIFGGKELRDDNSLQELNIQDGSSIHMVTRSPPAAGIPVQPPMSSNPTVAQHMSQNMNNNNNNNNNAGQQPSFGVARNYPNNPPPPPPQYNPYSRQPNPYQMNYQGNGGFNNHQNIPPALLEPASENARRVAEHSKFVQIFALLDSLFVTLLFFYGLYWLLPGIIATFLGYTGARKLHRGYVAVYGVFIVCYMAVRVYIITIDKNSLTIVMSIIVLMIEPYILHLVYRLYKLIPTLSDVEKEQVLYFIQMNGLCR